MESNNNNNNNNHNDKEMEEMEDGHLTASRIHDYMNLKQRMSVEEVRRTEVTYANYIETESLLSLQGSKVKQGLHHHDEHVCFSDTHHTSHITHTTTTIYDLY